MKTTNFPENVNSANVFNAVADGMKRVKNERSAANKDYYSLSKMLRDTQEKNTWHIYSPLFSALGLPETRKVSPKSVRKILHAEQYEEAKDGSFVYYIVKRVPVTKEVFVDGETVKVAVKDGEGNKMYTYSKQAIKDGAWTIDKFCKLILTAHEMNA